MPADLLAQLRAGMKQLVAWRDPGDRNLSRRAAASKGAPHEHTRATKGGGENRQNGVVLSRHETKGNAVAAGRRLASRLATELTVHGRDGKVLQTSSYATPTSPAQKA